MTQKEIYMYVAKNEGSCSYPNIVQSQPEGRWLEHSVEALLSPVIRQKKIRQQLLEIEKRANIWWNLFWNLENN